MDTTDGARTEQKNPVGRDAAPRRIPLPSPFFFYRDFSQEEDEDPLTPLTPVARVPNFPAKMHAILARDELSEIISWLPHGRAWKIFKPREFEIKVLPTYFNHCKLSSFIRQANGWGFRRISHGVDKNSYYHELFLRGMPYLCKKMRRPGVAEKNHMRPEYEPNLHEISKLHPVPSSPLVGDDSILLNFTVSEGPKARVPVGLFATADTDKTQTKLCSNEIQSLVTRESTNVVKLCPKTSGEAVQKSDNEELQGDNAVRNTAYENSVCAQTMARTTKERVTNLLTTPTEPHSHMHQQHVVGAPLLTHLTQEQMQRNNLLMLIRSHSMFARQTGAQGNSLASLVSNGITNPFVNFAPGIAGGATLEQIIAYQLLQNARR